MQPLRVAVEASDPITTAGLSAHLSSRPEIRTVVGRGGVDVDLLVLCTDIVNAEVIRRLRALSATSQTRSVLVTCEVRTEDVLSLVACGVVAILPRQTATKDRVVRTVLGARVGHSALPPDLLGALLDQVLEMQELAHALCQAPSSLGDRDRDVLRLLAEGLNTSEIAIELSYSERTVKNILYGCLSRLRVRNRSHAVATAIRAGVI